MKRRWASFWMQYWMRQETTAWAAQDWARYREAVKKSNEWGLRIIRHA